MLSPGGFAAQTTNIVDTAGAIDASRNGHYLVRVTASDGVASFARDIAIAVANTNQAPRVLPLPLQLVSEGETMSFTVRAADADNDATGLQLVHTEGMPAGILFDANTGYFEWTPGQDVVNNANLAHQPFVFTFSASDGQATTSQTVQVRVFDANRAPRITASNHALVAGQSFSLPVLLNSLPPLSGESGGGGFSAYDPDAHSGRFQPNAHIAYGLVENGGECA